MRQFLSGMSDVCLKGVAMYRERSVDAVEKTVFVVFLGRCKSLYVILQLLRFLSSHCKNE